MIELVKEVGRTFMGLPTASKRYVAAVGLGTVAVSSVALWFSFGLFRLGTPNLSGTSGRVTYQGNPVAIGQIAFEPHEARYGSGSAVPIRDGVFVLPASIGLRPSSSYRLLVTAYRLASEGPDVVKSGGNARANVTGQGASEEYVQFIPGRYNVDSELTVEATTQRLQKGLTLDLQ
jgi:hypothetical protein